VTGGAPVTLCEAANPYGASWAADDTILFAQAAGIFRVSANGGSSEVLIPMDAAGSGPQLLPDGHTVLFTLATTAPWDEAQIVTQSLDTGERRVLIEGGRDARYVPTGHVVYAVAETLLAVPFDVERLEVTGGPVPVVEGVASGGLSGSAQASISDSGGSLVYAPVSGFSPPPASQELVRVDREGNASPLTDTLGEWKSPRFSPDGKRLAVRRGDPGQDVWILELSRGTLTRLTFVDGLRPLWRLGGTTYVIT
jgi:serine/threonine-protein kinase